MNEYPNQLDYDWLAVDRLGRVAVFWTAGEGPLPLNTLLDRNLNEDALSRIRALAENGDGKVLVSLPNPSDVLVFVRRGVFVYDWTDVHRSIRKRTNRYELIGAPSAPRTYDEIAASSYRPVILPVDSFEDQPRLDIVSLVQCLSP